MNPNRFAAAFDYRSDTRVFLDVRSVRPTRAIRTEEGKKTSSQLFSCPRKTLNQKMIGMRFEEFLNLVIKFLNHLIELTQLAHQAFGR